MDYEKLITFEEEIATELSGVENIISIGIGHPTPGSNELGLIIRVKDTATQDKLIKKYNRNNISIELGSPLELDILRVPLGGTLSGEVSEDYNKYRPIIGGIQLYLEDSTGGWYGTLTGLVTDTETGWKTYALSNRHVLEKVGLTCYQPDKGNSIGKVCFDKDFKDTDAALALVDDTVECGANYVQDLGKIGGITDVGFSDIGRRVMKRGRTTLLTEGTIEQVNVRVWLASGAVRTNCVGVRSDSQKRFSKPGDSGSPVVIKDGKTLAGIHFASDGKAGGMAYFCKITNVFRNLNVELI